MRADVTSAAHVSQELWELWESEREAGNRAYAEQRRAQSARRQRDRVDALLDEVERLEDRLYLVTALLEGALELLDRRAAAHARTLELVAAVEEIDRLAAVHASGPDTVPDEAERKWGELLGEAKPGGTGANQHSSVTARNEAPPAERKAAHEARKLAAVPEPVFEQYVETTEGERAA